MKKVTVFLSDSDAQTRRSFSEASREVLRVALADIGINLPGDQLYLPYPELSQILLKSESIYCSISHTKGLVAVALASSKLGIDVEPLNQSRKWADMARAFFSPEEAAVVSGVSEEQQGALFLKHWVAKEAFIKATGGSVFGDLNTFVRTGENLGRLSHSLDEDSPPWWAWEAQYKTHVVGLCTTCWHKPEINLLNEDVNQGSPPVSPHWKEIQIE